MNWRDWIKWQLGLGRITFRDIAFWVVIIFLAAWIFSTHANHCRKHPDDPDCTEKLYHDE